MRSRFVIIIKAFMGVMMVHLYLSSYTVECSNMGMPRVMTVDMRIPDET